MGPGAPQRNGWAHLSAHQHVCRATISQGNRGYRSSFPVVPYAPHHVWELPQHLGAHPWPRAYVAHLLPPSNPGPSFLRPRAPAPLEPPPTPPDRSRARGEPLVRRVAAAAAGGARRRAGAPGGGGGGGLWVRPPGAVAGARRVHAQPRGGAAARQVSGWEGGHYHIVTLGRVSGHAHAARPVPTLRVFVRVSTDLPVPLSAPIVHAITLDAVKAPLLCAFVSFCLVCPAAGGRCLAPWARSSPRA